MSPYTEQLIKKIKSTEFLPLRQCSLCSCEVGWRHDNNDIFFDSSCDCTSYSETRYVEPDSLDFYTNQEWFRKEFGLEEQPAQQETES